MSTHDETCSKPKFGILVESRYSMQYPRTVEDTFHTLDEAASAAVKLLMVGEWNSKVTVCLVVWDKLGNAVETSKSFGLVMNGSYRDLIPDTTTNTNTNT